MSNVIDFKSKRTVQVPATFWDNFKDVLRKYYSENDVHLIVAAIMDMDCYQRTSDDIRKVADIYYKFAPEK